MNFRITRASSMLSTSQCGLSYKTWSSITPIKAGTPSQILMQRLVLIFSFLCDDLGVLSQAFKHWNVDIN